jgi:hypothetical protein
MCELINWITDNILSVATVALAIATYLMVREMKKAREEESRAYITADISYDDIRGFIDILNVGKKTAKNIKVEFIPDITPYLASNYKNNNPYKALRTMPPGSHKRVEIRNKIDAWLRPIDNSSMPVNFSIDVEYEFDGKAGKCRENFSIDLTYDKSIANPRSGYEPPKNL